MSLVRLEVDGEELWSYASLDEADGWLRTDIRLRESWPRLEDPPPADADAMCSRRLVAATRLLDTLPWAGKPAEADQRPRAWYRVGVIYAEGEPVPDTVLPADVERACCILAGASFVPTAEGDALDPTQVGAAPSKRLKAGAVEIEYFRPVAGSALPDPVAWRLVLPFLGVQGAAVARVTGTDEESAFDDRFRPRPRWYP